MLNSQEKEPEYNFKNNYLLEGRKQKLLSDFLNQAIHFTKGNLKQIKKKIEKIQNKQQRSKVDDKPYKCIGCSKTYLSNVALKCHIKSKHQNIDTPRTEPILAKIQQLETISHVGI